MNRIDNSIIHIARFTLEARTALSIGTGGPDGVYDHPIVRDANGLPAIPGTSFAGVLRHLWLAGPDRAMVDDLFGFQHRDRGESSRLEVAACCLQDSNGRPAEGLLIDAEGARRLREDLLLKTACATQDDPLFRDRVRLTHRGVADHRGKFDRGLLAAGHRFSGELRLWSTSRDDPVWDKLLGLLDDPRLRLGGATRAGLGAMRLVEVHCASLDLRQADDIATFRRLGTRLGDHAGLTPRIPATLPRGAGVQILKVRLIPRDFWRIGQGDHPLARHDKEPALLPKLEPLVRWRQGRATIATRLALVPGSSVKGALAHRTAFHWNALNGQFVEDMPLAELAGWDKSEHCEGVRAIFGYAKDRTTAVGRSRDDTGRAGLLFIDDVQVEIPVADLHRHVQAMIHNSLDRFTGGVRNRMLFTEELIYGHDFDLELTLLPAIAETEATARRALARALRDLCAGRLALGGGTTKGHGSFRGTPDEKTRAWLADQGEALEQSETLEDAA